MTVPSTPVQVRNLSVLNRAFRDALECSCGGQVCTKLTQLKCDGRAWSGTVLGYAALGVMVMGWPTSASIRRMWFLTFVSLSVRAW
jgi:hypothetical protein